MSHLELVSEYSTTNDLKNFVCTEMALHRLIKKFEETGNLNQADKSGRPSFDGDTIDMVKNKKDEMVSTHPLGIASTRKIAAALDMSKSSVHKILRKHLKCRPYRMRVLHDLKDVDYSKRLEFANWFNRKMIAIPDFDELVLWSDKSHFFLDDNVFTHQCIIWSTENPHRYLTKPLHPQRLLVSPKNLSFHHFSSPIALLLIGI